MKINRTQQIVLFGLLALIIVIFGAYSLGAFDFLQPEKEDAELVDANKPDEEETAKEPTVKEEEAEEPEQAPEPEPEPEQEPTIKVVNAPEVQRPERSYVAIVQSDKEKATDIEYEEIRAMVRAAVEMAGGLDELIFDGATVVLKPNLVRSIDYTLPNWNGRPLVPEANGCTTDYRVTRAVVELIRELNPSGKIYVMEGAAEPTLEAMRRLNYTHEYIPGVDEFIAIEEDSGKWHDYNSPGLVKVLLPNGLIHQEYYLNKKYQEADVLISLPALKNHWSAAVSGGIKNVGIGATPANIYGISPTSVGRNNMVEHDTARGDLHMWIHDFYLCRPVDYVIMDGLQGVQNGPTPCYAISGTDKLEKDQMNMRLIIAGKDPIAVDTIESLVMNWDPESVKHLQFLQESNAGNLDTSRITVVGKQVDEVRKDFEGRIPIPGGAKVTDFEAPSLSIKKSSVKDGILNLSLDVADETVKVEVYVDGKLYEPVITSNFDSISIDIGPSGKGKHKVEVYAFDRFLNRTVKSVSVTNDVAKRAPKAPDGNYFAARAKEAPVIDGSGKDSAWESAPWADISHVWLGSAPSPDDFSGRYKILWTPEKLYYLVEITDDVISETRTDPLDAYYEDDCVELFIDEDHSGGDHTYNYNAFAYHISTLYDVVDLDVSKKPRLYNDHVEVKMTKSGNTYTWEIAVDIYDDSFQPEGENTPVTLYAGKEMGYAIAYCDADETHKREHFIGSIDIPGNDKNVAWQNAGVFGTLKLIELD